jgi:hypothetical protein
VSHANCLELGDNFASSVDPNNVEEVEFELLKAPIRVELQFTSDWGEHSMLETWLCRLNITRNGGLVLKIMFTFPRHVLPLYMLSM